ncbi:MAG: hybrid sensor histidine kinase/response regulator, partial [Anaerolineales bacterium]|nr:hybrid sensor histidine kinase/response regulator [Anaerolineales bacterium]
MAANNTILYLEDDIGSQRLVKRVLENQGYRVVIAGEGSSGIALAKQEHPRLILMDINLPGMDGKEITTRLRSLPGFNRTPIVALTANISPGHREQALAAGCTGFMTKPIDVQQFPSQVADFLEGHEEQLDISEKSEHLELYAQHLVTRLENKIEELETANRRLRELDQMKSDFIALVSHELRTPLTLVSGYTFLLNEKAREARDVHNYDGFTPVVSGLDKGINRLGEVINEIINVARIASGTLELAVGPVRLGELVDEILRHSDEAVKMRNLNLTIEDLTGLPVIEGDGPQLRTALENVIGNAIKYTPDGGWIKIKARSLVNAVSLTVADSGVGIPESEQKRIFEQFHILGSIKNHSTSKSNFQGGGLGLGLPVAKGIIEAHGGRIWVHSEKDKDEPDLGSAFHILLPV